MEKKRVVVTGMGALTPIGNTLDEYWNNLINGVSGAAPIQQFDASNLKHNLLVRLKGLMLKALCIEKRLGN